ncbi:MAG: DUF4089 domain-containing protein [Pseudomonadota bacterium]
MSEPREADLASVTAMTEMFLAYLDLPLDETYRAGIIAHLMAAHGIAAPLLAFELDDEAELAPVFVA